MNYQVFPLGVGADQVQVSMDFDGAGTFGGGSDIVCGCMDDTACNYDAAATNDDGSCTYQTDPQTLNCDGSCIKRDLPATATEFVTKTKALVTVPTTNVAFVEVMGLLQGADDGRKCAQLMSAVFVAVKALLTAHATVTAMFSTSAVCAAVQALLTAHATVTATLLIAVANAVVMALLALVSA